ncbi:MAG: competence protein ComEA [Bacillota bacterium]|nr:helix-hairpin-helix domain-containing protein [Bacillota bacterium]MDK2929918.1 competence protein ComEA [Bacillota bacterium]
MFDLSRRQRFVVAVLLVAFGVGGVVLVARRLAGGDVVLMPGPVPLADGQQVEAAERDEPAKDSSGGGKVTVHVCGAVTTPGVYTLPSGSRVADAVRLAGGLAPGACPELVNMAKVLSDSVQVYIPMKPATGSGAGASSGAGSAAGCTEPSRVSETDHMRVNINTAGLAELDSLPGIGPALARRIIEHRNAKGRFERPEQLTDVPGIGPRKYDALKDLIAVH